MSDPSLFASLASSPTVDLIRSRRRRSLLSTRRFYRVSATSATKESRHCSKAPKAHRHPPRCPCHCDIYTYPRYNPRPLHCTAALPTGSTGRSSLLESVGQSRPTYLNPRPPLSASGHRCSENIKVGGIAMSMSTSAAGSPQPQ
jgi:hypothetical protein